MIYTITWSLVLLGMTLTAGYNQIMCSPDSGRIMEYEVMNHQSKACLRYNKITSEAGMTFYENILPNKRKHLTKKSWRNYVFHFFSKGFHPNTFRDIIIKRLNWIITKWGTQCHSCSWAIQHKSPLNIQYNNFEHTTTKCIIFTTSPDHIN